MAVKCGVQEFQSPRHPLGYPIYPLKDTLGPNWANSYQKLKVNSLLWLTRTATFQGHVLLSNKWLRLIEWDGHCHMYLCSDLVLKYQLPLPTATELEWAIWWPKWRTILEPVFWISRSGHYTGPLLSISVLQPLPPMAHRVLAMAASSTKGPRVGLTSDQPGWFLMSPLHHLKSMMTAQMLLILVHHGRGSFRSQWQLGGVKIFIVKELTSPYLWSMNLFRTHHQKWLLFWWKKQHFWLEINLKQVINEFLVWLQVLWV